MSVVQSHLCCQNIKLYFPSNS